MGRASIRESVRHGLVGGLVLFALMSPARAAFVPATLVFHVDAVDRDPSPVQFEQRLHAGDRFVGTLAVDEAVFASPEGALGAPGTVAGLSVRIGDAVFNQGLPDVDPQGWGFDFAGRSTHVTRLWGGVTGPDASYGIEIAGRRFRAYTWVLVPYDTWARCDITPDPSCGQGLQARWGQHVAGTVKLRFAGQGGVSLTQVPAPGPAALMIGALLAMGAFRVRVRPRVAVVGPPEL